MIVADDVIELHSKQVELDFESVFGGLILDSEIARY